MHLSDQGNPFVIPFLKYTDTIPVKEKTTPNCLRLVTTFNGTSIVTTFWFCRVNGVIELLLTSKIMIVTAFFLKCFFYRFCITKLKHLSDRSDRGQVRVIYDLFSCYLHRLAIRFLRQLLKP